MNNSIVCSETYSQLAAAGFEELQPVEQSQPVETDQELAGQVETKETEETTEQVETEQVETEQTEETPLEQEPFDFSSLEPDFDMAAKFLSRFGSQITFQRFEDREDCSEYPKHFHGDFDNLKDSLKFSNRAKAGIFFMVNEGDGRGRSAENVVRIRAIYADLDDSPIAPVHACKLPPHLIVESSPGRYHAYWFSVDVSLDKFRGLQKSLIHRFKSDDKVHDLPRVLRLPGFYHSKYEPVMSKVINESFHDPYTYEELLAEFPPVLTKPKKSKSSGTSKSVIPKEKYGDGERTAKLITEIGNWLQQRYSFDVVEIMAHGLNKMSFNPMLSDEKIASTVKSIIKSDQRNNPHRYSDNNQNTPTDIAAEMQKLNAVHAVVKISGKTLVMNEEHDPVFDRKDISFSSVADFHNYYSNKFCTITDSNGNTKRERVSKQWIDADRPTYKGVVFAPGEELKDYYNLYRGFATEPIEGDWSKMKHHIEEVLCAGNRDHAKWFLAWMARIVQDPGGKRPGTTPVLLSEQGAGKGIFVNYFGKIFGTHYVQITQRGQITGKFNNHLKDALLVFCDEGIWGGDKESESVLKGMITDPTLNIEPKGVNMFSVKNHINMIVASNEDWAAPVDIHDRRFCALDVCNDKIKNTDYFAEIAEQMDNGGLEAMHYDLLHLDISDVNLRIAPKTEALFKQMMEGFSSVECYWHECLSAGTFDLSYEVDPSTTFTPSSYQWPVSICKKKLYSHYHEFATHMGYRHIETNQKFYTKLKKLYPFEEKQPKVNGSRIREMVIPVLEELRKDFDKKVGVEIDW